MVANKVTSEITQAMWPANTIWLSPTAGSPNVLIAMEVASFMAFAARVKPMTMAIGPVTVAGRIFSMESRPKRLTTRPAAMDTKPDITMPNWATEIFSSSE